MGELLLNRMFFFAEFEEEEDICEAIELLKLGVVVLATPGIE